MSLPVRCYTCGSIIGKYEQKFITKLEEGMSENEILDNILKIPKSKYCCRRMFLGYVNTLDELLKFPKDIPTRNTE
jgi:DNA-directed RNA polymerase subunit N (RpoN/RPB10)